MRSPSRARLRPITGVSAAAAALALCASASASAATPGHVIGERGAARGSFAIASAQASVQHPRALWVRAIGRVHNVTIIVTCSRGLRVAANTVERKRAGLYRLPVMPRAEHCYVAASGGGSGRIALEVRGTARPAT